MNSRDRFRAIQQLKIMLATAQRVDNWADIVVYLEEIVDHQTALLETLYVERWDVEES